MMESSDILQLLKDASNGLTSEEMIVFDNGNKISSKQENSQEKIQNFKQTFGFKITNAKYIGQFRYNLKPIYIESNLSSILKNKTFFQTEDGKIQSYKVPNPTSLTLKQIRNIMVKLLYYQYDVFNGFSPYQSFLTCLYLFDDFYPENPEEIDAKNEKKIKINLLYYGLKLFLLTFLKTQCIANEIYTPSAIFSNEWSPFDFIKEEIVFDSKNFIIPNDKIRELIANEQDKTNLTTKSTKETSIKSFFDETCAKIFELLRLSQEKSIIQNEYTKQIINLITFEMNISKVFIQDIDDNYFFDEESLKKSNYDEEITKAINLLPETVNDLKENTPGFCNIINYPESDIKFNSDIKSYDDLKAKYSLFMKDVKYIDKFVTSLQKQGKIEELTNVFIDWNSTHCESITMIRFYFFRKFIPFYSNDHWELNLFRPSGARSQITPFEKYVSETFDKVKKLLPDHKNRMEKLFGKFFSYCLRLLIFRPYKLQKSLLKTVIIQWVRNIWQIYEFDKKQTDLSKKVFIKEMKNIFYNILHSDFKYYICYCFLTDILDMNRLQDMIFMYAFLFINVVLSPIYSDNNKAKSAFLTKDEISKQKSYNTERMKELRIYKVCFEILLYQYLNTVNHSKIELLESFRQNFYLIQKNVKKEYFICEPDKNNTSEANEFNIDDIFTSYNDYLNKFYDIRSNDFADFTKRITEELDVMAKEKENITSSRRMEYFKKFIKIAENKEDENSTLKKFFKKPLSFKFVFENAAYPYLIIKEQS